MARQLNCRVSESVWNALSAESDRTGDSISHVVGRALSSELGLDHHSLFQVSTSAALVEGVFQGCTRVRDLKRHGDFGLGTYEDLDGELIMLDGVCYHAGPGGAVEEVDDTRLVPFAVIARFEIDEEHPLEAIDRLEVLREKLDALRPSENVFVGLRLDGVFEQITLRVACKAEPGEDLVTATSHQSEFRAKDVEGTLVGFWTPAYARALNVPGYHFHFIDRERGFGGHLLDLKARNLAAAVHVETDLHIAIPETRSFLEANLQADPSQELEIAETGRARD